MANLNNEQTSSNVPNALKIAIKLMNTRPIGAVVFVELSGTNGLKLKQNHSQIMECMRYDGK